MSKSRRIQPAQKIAQQHAVDAARNLVEHQRVFDRKQSQLEELVIYLDEYTQGLKHKSHGGFNAAQMQDYNLFLVRLNRAIEQQKMALDSAREELETSRRVWSDKERRARAIDKVVSRHQCHEMYEQSRREQHDNDEHARRCMRNVKR